MSWTKMKLIALIVLLASAGVAASQDSIFSGSTLDKDALNSINEFADRLCAIIPIEGSGNDSELSGEGKAQLNGLLKKFADLGIEGAAKYQTRDYKGLLQKDLVDALRTSTECKREVFRELKAALIPIKTREPKIGSPIDYSAVVGQWQLETSGNYTVTWNANFYINSKELESVARKIKVSGTEASRSEKQTILKINGSFYGLEFRGDSEERYNQKIIRKKVYLRFQPDLLSLTGGLTNDGNEQVFNMTGHKK